MLEIKRTHIWQDRQTDRYTNKQHTEQEHQFLVLRRDRQTDRHKGEREDLSPLGSSTQPMIIRY